MKEDGIDGPEREESDISCRHVPRTERHNELPVHTSEDLARNIGAIIIRMKDLLHVNGVDEASAALVVGQVALNLLKIPTSDFCPI